MKKRVVAYCRVSSDHEDQINSLENQKKYWEEYIKKHEDMEFIGLYVDEGITGTSTLKRDGFNCMIKDALNGKFDFILTKEVSRFGRNIVDVLKYTRTLKDKGVGVFFQTDNINTLDNDGELRLSIMATLAQEESRKISERVKWGHKQAMKNGVVFGADRILGYDLKNKQLIVNPKEAEIVKNIYNWYLDGESLHGIVKKLNEQGIYYGKEGGKINHSSIRRILTNEKYCGDLKQKKFITTNYLTHDTKKNEGEEEYIIIYDHHPAIVEKEKWNKVQELLHSRYILLKEKKIGYNRSIFGGKIICKVCGSKFRRKTLKNKDGSDRPVWICNTNHEKGLKGCQNGSYIREDILKYIFIDLFKQLQEIDDIDSIINNMILSLDFISDTNNNNTIEDIKRQINIIQNKKSKLLDLYMDENSGLSKSDFIAKNDELIQKENELKKALNTLENQKTIVQNKKQRMQEFIDVLKSTVKFEYSQESWKIVEGLLKEILEKIEIDKKTLSIYLLTGKHDINLNKYPSRVSNRDYTPIKDIILKYNKWGFGYKQIYKIKLYVEI